MHYTAKPPTPLSVSGQSYEEPSVEFSRRQVVEMIMLGSIGLAISPQSANASEESQTLHAEIERIGNLAVKAQAAEPNLPGFRNMETWAANNSFQKISPQNADILQGALYLEALRLLKENQKLKTPAPSLETVRAGFTSPEPMSCFTDEYLNNLLSVTQKKMSNHSSFARKVNEASAKARRIGCKGGGGGDIPPWICRVIIVVIIIVIIVV